jgi:copper chaperone
MSLTAGKEVPILKSPTPGGEGYVEEAMLKLKIEGMTCGHCVMHVKQAITKVPGVQGPVEVSLEKGEALVNGAPSLDAVLAAVKEEGYTASLAS